MKCPECDLEQPGAAFRVERSSETMPYPAELPDPRDQRIDSSLRKTMYRAGAHGGMPFARMGKDAVLALKSALDDPSPPFVIHLNLLSARSVVQIK